MAIKITSQGLIYNDGEVKNVNINTSSKIGKFHIINCPKCNAKNRISLEAIKRKVEFDKIHKKNNGYNNKVGSVMNFRCGNCNEIISHSEVDNEVKIYTLNEYNTEVGSFLQSLKTKR